MRSSRSGEQSWSMGRSLSSVHVVAHERSWRGGIAGSEIRSDLAGMAESELAAVAPRTKIDVQDVMYEYREHGTPVRALDDVSFKVGEREIVTLVGPSGCGKTTLLHIVAGFFKPTAGVVLVNGKEVSAPGPERGIVFQNYALFRWLTVRGNVEFGPRMRGVGRRERRDIAEHYLGLVGLTSFADKYVY